MLSRGARPLPNAEVVAWTPGQRGDWEQVLDGATAVVQLTGESLAGGRWTPTRKARFYSSRVTASRVLAEAVVERGAEVCCFLQGSAVGYYGDRGDEELDEQSVAGEGYLPELCRGWEAASALVEEAGIRRPIARTGLVLAAGGALIRQMSLPFRLGFGGPIGNGRQWMPWIHLEDEVAALLWLLERDDAAGPYNLAAPGVVTNQEFSRTLAKELRRPCWLRVPSFALRLALGEMSALALEGQRVVPSRLEKGGFSFAYSELSAALRAILARS